MELSGFHAIDHVGAHRGATAIINMLSSASGLSGRSRQYGPAAAPWVRCSISSDWGGLFEAERKPGDQIRKGERIGWVRSLTGEPLGEIKSPQAGLLLEIQPLSALHVGMRAATVAVERKARAR
jgi:predicted deacylase